MGAEAIAIVAAAVGLLAVLLPLLLTIRADVGEVRRGLHALAERVARIEGALTALGARPRMVLLQRRSPSRPRLTPGPDAGPKAEP